MKKIFWNMVKGKSRPRYLMAVLLIFVFMMAGCGAADSAADQKLGDGAADEVVNNDLEDTDSGNVDEETENASDIPEGSMSGEESAAEDEDIGPAEDGAYTSKEDVARYIYIYGHLPSNFITKKEAEELGWQGGSLEPYAPGKCIGGSRFGNYEGLLPEKDGRVYTECDIDTLGAEKRGAKRIVFSNDGFIYYTGDHYESFELLYGED